MADLRRIAFRLSAPLPSLNVFTRTGHWQRSRDRTTLAWEIAVLVPRSQRPAVPLDKARITVVRRARRNLDRDNFQTKHLLDILQPFHEKIRPAGLGIIRNDTDDCVTLIRRYEAVSKKQDECTLVEIEEISP